MIHTGPDAPHWYHFKEIGDAPNDWEFRHLKTASEEEEVACLETEQHRIVIITTLVRRERTADRYATLYYEPASVDPLDETKYEDQRLPFYQAAGMGDGIARNNVSVARETIEEGTDPYVAVVEADDERTVYEVPCEYLAESAADLYTRMRMDSDRDVRALVYEKEDWEFHREIERSVEGDADV